MDFTGVTYRGQEIEDKETFDSLPKELKDFYKQINGIIAFNGGLHIRGCVSRPDWHSIADFWTGEKALFKSYKELTAQDIPFGQDCVGDQYILRDNIVHRLNGETGELKNLGTSFGIFLEHSISNPMEFLSLQPLQRFINDGGQLKPGELLNVVPPFCIKSDSGVSLRSIPTIERIDFLVHFYNEIKDLQEGQEIKFKIVP